MRVRASIGVALASRGASSADELLRNADLAMYAAKAGGRSRSAIFSPGMHDAEHARHALVNDLREAIAQGHIQPHFQPLVDLGSGRAGPSRRSPAGTIHGSACCCPSASSSSPRRRT